VGRETLAPNFNKYTHLQDKGSDTMGKIIKNYHTSMNNTRLTQGEYVSFARKTNDPNYRANNIQLQIGNMDEPLYQKLSAVIRHKNSTKMEFSDCKIMATDHDLWHGTGHKLLRIRNAKKRKVSQKEINNLLNQLIDEKDYDKVYETLQKPELVYQDHQVGVKDDAIELHFVKKMENGKVLRIVLRSSYDAKSGTYRALKFVTMETVNENDYLGIRYTEIKR
jgi:hypothetical protein